MAFAPLPAGVPAPSRNLIVEYHFLNQAGALVTRPAIINEIDEPGGTIDLFVFYNEQRDSWAPAGAYRVVYGMQPHGWTWPPRV